MKAAAIFDIDGTLLPWPSTEVRFVSYLVNRKVLRSKDLLALPFRWARLAAANRSITRTNRTYLAEKEVASVRDCVDEFFQQSIAPHLCQKAIARVQAHESKGHLLILLSGTLDFLLVPFQLLLEAHVAVGTRLEEVAGKFTGRVDGSNVTGAEKARWLRHLQTLYDIDLRRSYAYGNHRSDSYFLQMVGHPVAINPDRRLRARALAENWAIENWT